MKYVFLEEACRTLLLVVSNTQPSAYIPSDLYVIEDPFSMEPEISSGDG